MFLYHSTSLSLYNDFTPCIRDHRPHFSISVIRVRVAIGAEFEDTFKETTYFLNKLGFPGGTSCKEPTCQCRRHLREAGSIPGSERFPWRRKWQPTAVLLPGESHEQRSLAGYSTWGLKELDTNEATQHSINKLFIERQ